MSQDDNTQAAKLVLDERIGLQDYQGIIHHFELTFRAYVENDISGEDVKVIKELLSAVRQTISDKKRYGNKVLNPEMQTNEAPAITARGPFGIALNARA